MLCEKCGFALRICRSWYSVTGDGSPREETKLFSNAELRCVNPKCPARGRAVIISRPTPLGAGERKGDEQHG